MSERTKGKLPVPAVQVIRKPGATASPTGGAPAPVAPTPGPVTPAVRPVAPRPTGPRAPQPGPRPTGGSAGPAARPPFRGPPRPSTPRPPPTAEAIAALARKERVPNRIAKGELEGKMKCRIWKKLHAEEAKRFDQAWTLMEATPGLELADAFGVVQSGLSVEDFQARRARAKKRDAIKEARATLDAGPIDAFVAARIAEGTELAVVLGERTALDVLTAVAPVSFTTSRSGQLEKLHVVLLARKPSWDSRLPTLERDPKLSQKPANVARQPARRPVSDPRPFLDHVGHAVGLQLRNGVKLEEPLLAVGPFDLLLGEPGDELFVPLHAIVSWAPRAG